MINWPDLMLPPINLWSLGADHSLEAKEDVLDEHSTHSNNTDNDS